MLPEQIVPILQRQHGLVAQHQIRAIEPCPSARRAIYRNRDLERLTPRVLRHRASPPSTHQSLHVGVLDAGPGGQLWGKSAAGHWGFGRFRLLPPHVAVRRAHVKGDRVGQLHIVRNLDDIGRTIHADIPIARPEVVILWLAGMWTHRFGHEIAGDRVAAALDQAWRQRLIDGRFLHELTARSGGKGRSGIVVMRQALEQRPPDYKPAGSRLEERFEETLPVAVRKSLDRQVTVDVEPTVRTVDYRLCTWPLIIEINGEVFHTSLTDRTADAERYEHVLSLGFSVVIFWEYDIWHDPSTVCRAMTRLHGSPDLVPTLHRPTKAPWE